MRVPCIERAATGDKRAGFPEPGLGIVRRVSFLFVLLALAVIIGIGAAALRFSDEQPLED